MQRYYAKFSSRLALPATRLIPSIEERQAKIGSVEALLLAAAANRGLVRSFLWSSLRADRLRLQVDDITRVQPNDIDNSSLKESKWSGYQEAPAFQSAGRKRPAGTGGLRVSQQIR